MKILYVTSAAGYFTNTVYDYDSSFSKYSKNEIYYFNIEEDVFDFPLDGFDALIFSYSFFMLANELSQEFKNKINSFSGIKVAIFQDEYNSFLRHRGNLKAFDITAIVTLVPEQHWHDVFCEGFSHLPHLHTLAGYIPEYLKELSRNMLPLAQRRWHIGYRGRVMQPILGKLAREKYDIGVSMKALCELNGIPANIEVEENKRIYGEGWINFIRDCRVLLGTESGSNVFDFDGRISKKIAEYQSRHPSAPFDVIHAECIGNAEGKIKMNQISPKMFEAIAVGTGHILFEGEYSGILKPWKHYIPLKKDYSNLSEVFDAVNDTELLQGMIEQSISDVVLSGEYSYERFIRRVDDFLDSLNVPAVPARPWQPVAALQKMPRMFSDDELRGLQQAETKRVAALAAGYTGKTVLFFGAGAAFEKYKHFFAKANVVGMLVDDAYIKESVSTISGVPVLNTKALANMHGIDKIVVFCRLKHRFLMLERIRLLMPQGPQPDYCILYDQKPATNVECVLPPLLSAETSEAGATSESMS